MLDTTTKQTVTDFLFRRTTHEEMINTLKTAITPVQLRALRAVAAGNATMYYSHNHKPLTSGITVRMFTLLDDHNLITSRRTKLALTPFGQELLDAFDK